MSSNNGSMEFSECTDLNKLNSTAEQCIALLTVDALRGCSENSWIDYTYLFYCQIGSQSIVLPLIVSSFILFILFIALGITADDFLCPSLLAISKSLKLNQGIVGVTFLAFGNGAPDIITSFSGISKARPELVIGSLFGAGVFVTTIVFGSILICSDFKLTERPLIRDVIFYLASCFFAWAIVYQQAIHLWQVILFLLIYLGYIVSVIAGRFVHERLTSRRNKNQSTEAIVNSNDTTPCATPPSTYKKFNNDLDSSGTGGGGAVDTHPRVSNNLDTTVPSISVTVSPDSIWNIDSPDDATPHLQSNETARSNELYNTASLANSNSIYESFRSQSASRSRSSSLSPNKNTLDADIESSSNFKRNRSNTSSIHSKRSLRGHHENALFTLTHSDEFMAPDEKCTHSQCLRSPISSGFVDSTVSSAGVASTEAAVGDAITCATNQDDTNADEIKYLESLTWWQDLLVHIQPFDGNEFYTASKVQKIMTLIRSPFYIILTLTVPVVDCENHLSNWCRLLNAFHCISGPLVLLLVGGFFFDFVYEIPLALIVTLIGCALATAVMLTSQFRRPPVYHCLFAYLGFVVSVTWTYTLASEVVSLLKSIGILLDVSDVILGLTVLALGNSLGDFVSNLSMARQGFPRIGVSACFGGPLMNLLLGIGIPYSVLLAHAAPEYSKALTYPRMLTLLIATLAISLATSVFILIGLSFRSHKVHGFILIAIYVVYIILALLIEFNYL